MELGPDLTPTMLTMWLERRGWPDEALALQIGVAHSTVWRWRTGQRRIPPYLWLVLWAIEQGALGPRAR